jgi:hypothetical protein
MNDVNKKIVNLYHKLNHSQKQRSNIQRCIYSARLYQLNLRVMNYLLYAYRINFKSCKCHNFSFLDTIVDSWIRGSRSVHIFPYPVRIRVRIGPPHPLVCRKRRLNGAILRVWPDKTEVPCHCKSDTMRIPPCSKALSIGLNFAALHWQWWRLHIVKNSWAGRKTVNNQSINPYYKTIITISEIRGFVVFKHIAKIFTAIIFTITVHAHAFKSRGRSAFALTITIS